MDDKWFSESKEGAEAFAENYPDELTNVVEAEVPKEAYDRAEKNANIDRTGPGFAVPKEDQPLVKPKLPDE